MSTRLTGIRWTDTRPTRGTRPSPRRTSLVLSVLLAVLGLVALAACSGSGSGDDAGSAQDSLAEPAAVARDEAVTDEAAGGDAESVSSSVVQERAVISTGVVSLRGTDVSDVRFDVLKVVDTHRGTVTDQATETDEDGTVSRARLVIRVPAQEFAGTMAELEKVADLESSSSTSEDVTTQVIDTRARIRAQEASLERVEILFDRAQSIRDIIAIEAQLTRRQAELDSLKQQMAWLEDQTSMSTITVHLERTTTAAQTDDDSGFLAGLQKGWDALTAVAVGAATLLGAVLPFAVVLAVLAVPLWRLARHSRRRGSGPGSGPDVADSAV
ncbi:MAG TPA: DUF4349 domain-containing protein [Nocardioides sp.]|uniref:DUF4349 domain-containing protein n=1 Tax=Nocardioides sp. TaxID=35761 RepID=UPI002B649BD0|nr:DUF4349 domain-containing protein [Nocardioides sp.]HQR26736.1 DUF4349 domain-containing protein [Nocardioides sp.]